MMDQEFRLIAPDVKRLLGCYERRLSFFTEHRLANIFVPL